MNERMCAIVKERACVCVGVAVWERNREKRKLCERKKFHDDMLVIYSPTAGLYINTDLLQCLQVIQGLAV